MNHHRGLLRLCAVVTLAVSAIGARSEAATIVAETGRDAYGWQARTDEFSISSWTQTNTYFDVSIVARLYSVATGDRGTAYLTTRIGPGATVSNQVATATFTFPDWPNPSDVQIFSGLTLGPGTYYLIIAGGTNYWSAWYGTDQPTRTLDSGVTLHEDVYVVEAAAYPPASRYHDHSWMYHIFSVTGFRAGENRPPTADAGPDQYVACTGGGTSVLLDGRGSSDPEGTALSYTWWQEGAQIGTGASLNVALSSGSHTFKLIVTDGDGISAEDTVVVHIADQEPPEIRASASPSVLRPPNGKLVPVLIRAKVVDMCDGDASARIVAVESDDPTFRQADYQITGDLTVKLRARRGHRSAARTYSITVQASDSSGNTAETIVQVVVPR